MKILKKRFIWQKKVPREVKIATIKALSHYPGEKSRKILVKLSKSKDRYIKSNAEHVLEEWN